jgi:hypothetical protein
MGYLEGIMEQEHNDIEHNCYDERGIVTPIESELPKQITLSYQGGYSTQLVKLLDKLYPTYDIVESRNVENKFFITLERK